MDWQVFVSGQCLVHTHCFVCWLLLRSSLFCVVNDNDFVFFCLCLSLRRSTEKASILLRFWDLMQPGVTDGMIPDFCILNCCAAASYYRTALYIWKHPSARLPSRNTISHYNDSVYTPTENVNIIDKKGCGLDCKKGWKRLQKRQKSLKKRPWQPHEKRVSYSCLFPRRVANAEKSGTGRRAQFSYRYLSKKVGEKLLFEP